MTAHTTPLDENDRHLNGTLPDGAFDDAEPYESEPANDRPASRTIKLVGAAEMAKPLPNVEYLIPSLGIASGAPVLVAGYGFGGKTVALQSLAVSIAAGKPVWGMFACQRGSVLHLDFEQGRRVTFGRYQRLSRAMGVELAALGDRLRVGVNPAVYLDDDDAVDVYQRHFEGFAVVIVDSLRAGAQRAKENDSEIRRTLDLMNRAAEPHGTVIIFIHHARKPKADDPEGARYRIRGSSALFDACGSVFVFAAEKGHPTRVEHEKCRNRGVLVDSFGLRVEDVEIGGDPKAGLRVVHLEAPQLVAAESKGQGGYEKSKRRILHFLNSEGEFRGSRSSLRERVKIGRSRFFAAMDELVSRGEAVIAADDRGVFIRAIRSPVPSGTPEERTGTDDGLDDDDAPDDADDAPGGST